MTAALRPLACAAVFALLAACASVGAPRSADAGIGASDAFDLPAQGVDAAPLHVQVLLPPGYDAARHRRYRTLYVNDGQDAQAVDLRGALVGLSHARGAHVPITVAITMPHDRMGAYGLSDRARGASIVGDSKYGPVGAKAQAYSRWVATVLVPYVDAHYRTRARPRDRAILGWSLGALNAFDLGWQYPDVFGTVGAFSPSFWLPADKARPQATRLVQGIVDRGPQRRGLRLFLTAGDAEETDDRDGDGTIDVIDDARDLLLGDGTRRGLRQLGYRVDADWNAHPQRRSDAVLAIVHGGKHEQAAWRRALPVFFDWAYGKAPLPAPSPLADPQAGP